MRKRISVRYAVAIFLVVGTAMIAQGLVTTWFAWDQARRLVAETQVARVAGATDRIEHFVRDIEIRLAALVATPWLARDDKDRRIDALRLMREVAPLPIPAMPSSAFGAGLAALVVDEDPLALDATMVQLEDWGFEVTGVPTVEEASAVAARTSFDVAVCDRHLGGADGLDLARGLVAAGRARTAVLVSGDTGEALAAEARAVDVPLLAKPVSPMTLRAQVLALLAASPA